VVTDPGPPGDRWEETWAIFHDVLEQPREGQRQSVEEACGGDPDLRREVEELLTAHEEGLAILDDPTLAGSQVPRCEGYASPWPASLEPDDVGEPGEPTRCSTDSSVRSAS
jgi:hypothetical protein